MARRYDRRDVIRGIGAAGVVGLAGCTGGDGGDDGDGDGGDGGDGGGGDGGDGGGNGGDGGDGGYGGDGGGNGGGGGPRTIRMGLLMGVTGGLEQLGPPIRDAAQLVPKQVSNADTDYSIDTQFEDTGTSPSQGVSGAEALVSAGYPMICGALSSEVTIQTAKNVSIPNGITQCSPASTSPRITTLEDNDYVFRTPPTDALQGQVVARIAAERLGHSTASVLYLNNAYGNGLAQGFADAFENEYGGTITAQVSFAKGQSSYTSKLQSALQGDPGTMLVVGYPDSGVQIFRDFYSDFNRNDMDVLVSDGLQDGNLPSDVGYDMTNVKGTAPTGAGPGLEFFQQRYEEEYGESAEGQPFIKQAYDAAAVLVLANAAAGENDGAAVRDQMREVTVGGGTEVTPSNLVEGVEMAGSGENIQYKGVSGPVQFDENGDLASASYAYFEFTGDGLEVTETITP
jgi:ABC-type branched-subunit amino acid transport system substrate-binding protein